MIKPDQRSRNLPQDFECSREIISKGLTVRQAAIRLKVGKTALYEAIR
jgi:hypothetical protein